MDTRWHGKPSWIALQSSEGKPSTEGFFLFLKELLWLFRYGQYTKYYTHTYTFFDDGVHVYLQVIQYSGAESFFRGYMRDGVLYGRIKRSPSSFLLMLSVINVNVPVTPYDRSIISF